MKQIQKQIGYSNVFVCECLALPDSGVLKAIRAYSLKTGRAEIRSLLHRKADRSYKYVDTHVLKKTYIDFGYTHASYQFWMRRRDGHSAREDVSRRLRARNAKILSDINGHRIETLNQAVLAAGASKKTQIRLSY